MLILGKYISFVLWERQCLLPYEYCLFSPQKHGFYLGSCMTYFIWTHSSLGMFIYCIHFYDALMHFSETGNRFKKNNGRLFKNKNDFAIVFLGVSHSFDVHKFVFDITELFLDFNILSTIVYLLPRKWWFSSTDIVRAKFLPSATLH